MTPRTAKRAAQSKLAAMAIDNHDSEGVSDDTEDENSTEGESDAESEYGSSGPKRSSQPPPQKRARTSQQKSPAKKPAGGRKSLSLLPTMPLDILYEIFGNLSPKDIFNLAKTNKIFRQTLLSPHSITVWIAARQRFGAPDPPEDMSEIAWAALLFGNTCQKCGAKNVQKVDFLLRLRVCNNCKKAHLVVQSRFKSRFPDVETSILDLIPYTNTGGWSHGYASNSKFFWDGDIDNMIKKLAVLEDDVHRRRPNASKKLADFKEQRMTRVTAIGNDATKYAVLLSSAARERQEASRGLQKQRQEAIIERFIELGYARQDVFCWRKEFQGTTQLSDRIWQRIRPILEPEIADRKAKRLETEYANIQKARRCVVDDLYKAYKSSLRSTQWKFLPRTFTICQLAPFAAVIDAPATKTITAADFTDAMQPLPELLSSVSAKLQEKARALLPTAPNLPLEPGEVESPDVLDLAISVFACNNPTNHAHGNSFVVIGSEDLLSHHCDDPDYCLRVRLWYSPPTSATGQLTYSQQGSEIAARLVRLAGLDPRSALASDMDKKDLRFSCSRCYAQKFQGSWYRRGYSWRTAITHVLKHGHSGSYSQYLFTVLSSQDANAVKACEQSNAKWDSANWTCGRCSAYLGDTQRRLAILEHLKAEHQIADPKEGEDLVFFERFRSPFRGDITYPVPQPTPQQLNTAMKNGTLKVHCRHCASVPSKSRRLFEIQGVRQHIQVKHGITDPQMEKDYIQAAGIN